MGVSKAQRQHHIAGILAGNMVTNQAELTNLLSAEGIIATQATISRDLEEIGAIKVRTPAGESAYAIPDLPRNQLAPVEYLRRVLREWLVDIGSSGNIAVVRTPPGSAHVIANAVDRAGLRNVLATVAGDDTVAIIAVEGVPGSAIVSEIQTILHPEPHGS